MRKIILLFAISILLGTTSCGSLETTDSSTSSLPTLQIGQSPLILIDSVMIPAYESFDPKVMFAIKGNTPLAKYLRHNFSGSWLNNYGKPTKPTDSFKLLVYQLQEKTPEREIRILVHGQVLSQEEHIAAFRYLTSYHGNELLNNRGNVFYIKGLKSALFDDIELVHCEWDQILEGWNRFFISVFYLNPGDKVFVRG